MNTQEQDRIRQLLKDALPPVDSGSEPARDLWPIVLKRLDEHAAGELRVQRLCAWFDVALLAGLVVMGTSFPAAIPLLLYYL